MSGRAHNTPAQGGPVYIQKAGLGNRPAIQHAVENLFASIPAAAQLGAGSKVLIKPNLLAKHTPGEAVTTDPDVVRAVVLCVQARGATDITIADSPGGPYTPKAMQGIYKATGMATVAAETGAKLYTACESCEVPAKLLPTGLPDTSGAKRLVHSFTVLRPVVESNFIINVPKLKTHVMAYMSGAVKNLFGCVPGLQKAEFHMRFPQREHFGQMLVDLCETVGANMHIVDGLLAMEGDGPAGGAPRQLDLLLGGEDPYTIDLALCRLMGLAPMHAPMLAAAAHNGLCGESFDTRLLWGDTALAGPVPGFTAPKSFAGRVDFSNKIPRVLQPLAKPFLGLASPKPRVVKATCIGCGKCAEICPQKVITIANGKARIAYKNCIRCFCCHEMCPVKAIDVVRNPLLTNY